MSIAKRVDPEAVTTVVVFKGPGRARQSMKDECDINKIMGRFVKTGVISHVAKYAPQYGEFPAIDYRDALDVAMKAERMFAELPAKVRRRFDNRPDLFLEFMEDPENRSEAAVLGLLSDEAVASIEAAEAAAEAAARAAATTAPASPG